jgi:hypothetical protein
MTNVFKFPESKIVREIPVNVEEVEKVKEKGKQKYADGIVAEVATGLLGELENYGVELEDDEGNVSKDFIFLTDVLKSVIYRTMGLKHSLHEFVDENVAIFTMYANSSRSMARLLSAVTARSIGAVMYSRSTSPIVRRTVKSPTLIGISSLIQDPC